MLRCSFRECSSFIKEILTVCEISLSSSLQLSHDPALCDFGILDGIPGHIKPGDADPTVEPKICCVTFVVQAVAVVPAADYSYFNPVWGCIFSITWSRLKLAAFGVGGYGRFAGDQPIITSSRRPTATSPAPGRG